MREQYENQLKTQVLHLPYRTMMRLHTHTHTYLHTKLLMHTSTDTYTHIHTHTHTHTHIHTHTHTHTRICSQEQVLHAVRESLSGADTKLRDLERSLQVILRDYSCSHVLGSVNVLTTHIHKQSNV
jgi:hypothetical protein